MESLLSKKATRPVVVPVTEEPLLRRASVLPPVAKLSQLGGIRLKITYEDMNFVIALIPPPAGLAQLSALATEKLQNASSKLEIAPPNGNIRMRYVDEQKDTVLLLDDIDLETALHFSPNSLHLLISNQ